MTRIVRPPPGFGKRVIDDWYIHRVSIESLEEQTRWVFQTAMESAPKTACDRANVLKVNLRTSRISLLRYDDFFDAPFPVLSEAWSLSEPCEGNVAYRSYQDSLNPPILHRKELLLPPSHPLREKFVETTRQAEALGLFDETATIGFRENWLRLVASKGYEIVGNDFVPIGNVKQDAAGSNELPENTPIFRHLTALSRSSLSAPIQLLLRHALLSQGKGLFDYGCGKGDDIANLNAQGYSASGWDPFYATENAISRAPIVNLGFVLNVIEDPDERREALYRAFQVADEVMSVAVMLRGSEAPGLSYRDGVRTSRNTFQKYFHQEELKQYVERELGEEAFLVGPGVCFVFKDKDVEQRFVANRYRRKNLANRILRRPNQVPRLRPNAFERLSCEARALLERLWKATLDLGRMPDKEEVSFLPELECHVGTLRRALHFLNTAFDQRELSAASAVRADDLRLYFAMGQFAKRPPYKRLEARLQKDIKYFFGDYHSAHTEGLRVLKEAATSDAISSACRTAAELGMGWLDREGALHLHTAAIDRLPVVLRAYVSCGLLIYGDCDAQLAKVHPLSGKLSLLEYENFDLSPLPLLLKRIKINIRKQDYEIFEYGGKYEKPLLYFKSRYLNEEYPGYAEQLAFDDELARLDLFDPEGHGLSALALARSLELQRRYVRGFSLLRSDTIPCLDQPCGRYYRYRDFIDCGETQTRSAIENTPQQPESFNALHDLASNILDPVIDYFGGIKLTYGFCSHKLSKHIKSRIAPDLDQHAAFERTSAGKLICDRGGAACDFIVPDEDMEEVCHWIMENLPFDRLYFYGKTRPIHVSYAENPQGAAYEMRVTAGGRRVPRAMKRLPL